MTMVSSGPISLGGTATTGGLNQSVNVELGRSGTATINMNESAVRSLAGVPSGAISLSNFYGKSSVFNLVYSANTANVDLRAAAVSGGWNQSSAVTCTINSGVVISSSSTGTAAMIISGSFPGGVSVTNNGTIVGMGGAGGTGRGSFGNFGTGGSGGSSGGLALSVSTAVTITNNGTIAGGGGGGGGGMAFAQNDIPSGKFYLTSGYGGGGGGGGRSSNTNSAGGTGGSCTGFAGNNTTGGTGGSGTYNAAGAAGTSASFNAGGAGGGWGSSGAQAPFQPVAFSLGGPFSGGSGGGAVSGNSNITWAATGTRIGGIS